MKTIQLPPSSYLKTYYQTLDKVTWLVAQKNCMKDKFFEKKERASFIKKFLKFE